MCLTYCFLFYLAPSVRIERTTSSLTVKRNYRCATRECSLAVRLRLELRTRITPSDRLAICSNTIIGPFQRNTYTVLTVSKKLGVPWKTRTFTNGFGDRYAAITLRIHMVVVVGIDPTSSPYEGGTHPSTSHNQNWGVWWGSNPRISESQPEALPLGYKHHIETHWRELPLRQTSLLCQYNMLQYSDPLWKGFRNPYLAAL